MPDVPAGIRPDSPNSRSTTRAKNPTNKKQGGVITVQVKQLARACVLIMVCIGLVAAPGALASHKGRAPIKKNASTRVAEHHVMVALKANHANIKKTEIQRHYGKWQGTARFIVVGKSGKKFYATWVQGKMFVTARGVVDWEQHGETGYISDYPSVEAALQGVADIGGGDFGGGKV
jgi:hypothetical protein